MIMSRSSDMQVRNITSNLKTREEDGELYLEGYFLTYNKETELWDGVYEEISPGACSKYLDQDIRALTNHDTTLVLGRNKSNTLVFKEDNHGLWGRIKVNKQDSDAMNTYQRVKRGDISGNSFGGFFVEETITNRDDGTVKFTVNEIDLREVSVCTFPAYEDTSIQARKKEYKQYEDRQRELIKNKLQERLNKIC